jgi:hypothetical protein
MAFPKKTIESYLFEAGKLGELMGIYSKTQRHYSTEPTRFNVATQSRLYSLQKEGLIRKIFEDRVEYYTTYELTKKGDELCEQVVSYFIRAKKKFQKTGRTKKKK